MLPIILTKWEDGLVTLNEVKKQLKQIGANQYILSRSEIRYLPRILLDDEIIHEYVNGTYSGGFGVLIATNKRLLFVDKKIFDFLVDDIPYSMVSAVEYDLGMFWGRITVFSRAKDFRFKRTRKDRTMQFARFIESKMMKSQEDLMGRGKNSKAHNLR